MRDIFRWVYHWIESLTKCQMFLLEMKYGLSSSEKTPYVFSHSTEISVLNMLNLQEISDRFEIQDLVFRYSDIIDTREFDLLRTEIFTEDAFIDYTAMGGESGDLESTINFLKVALDKSTFPKYQHLNANIQLTVTDNQAVGRIMCFNPMEIQKPDGGRDVFFLGLWYLDNYIRTDIGWRMSKRVEESSWRFNLTDFLSLNIN